MIREQFEIYSPKDGLTFICNIDTDGLLHHVSIDGDYKGEMINDPSANFGYATNDEELASYLPAIQNYYRQAVLIAKFAITIMEIWKGTIVDTDLLENKKLIIRVADDTDVDEFGQVFKDLMVDYVKFRQPLDVEIFKNNDPFTVNFRIN